MDGYDFYYETRTKVNVFLQEKMQITLHQFLLPFIAGGETPTRRTVTLLERCLFLFHRDKLCFQLPVWFRPRATRGVEIGGCFALVAGG